MNDFEYLKDNLGVNIQGLKIADFLKPGNEMIGCEDQSVDFQAFDITEIPAEVQQFDLIMLRDYDDLLFASVSPLAWRCLKIGGKIYVTHENPINNRWRGWVKVGEIVGPGLNRVLIAKIIPGDLPFKLRSNSDTVRFSAKKSGRWKGHNEQQINNQIIKWCFVDCSIYFLEISSKAPMFVIDIGPAE